MAQAVPSQPCRGGGLGWCLLAAAEMLSVLRVQHSALPQAHLSSPKLRAVTPTCLFCFTGASPGRDRLTLCAGAKSWAVGGLGCFQKQQSLQTARLRGATWHTHTSTRALSMPRRGHAGLGSPVPPPRHIHGEWEGQLLQLHTATPQAGKQFQSEGIPHPRPPAIAAA